MPIIKMKYITREFMRKHPEMSFVFGDNETRIGMGGQAKEMRGEPNAIGVRTKAKPLFAEDAYWTDKTYTKNARMILEDIQEIFDALEAGRTVVFPEDGIGTGMAQLEVRAPLTYKYLQSAMNTLYEEYKDEEAPRE